MKLKLFIRECFFNTLNIIYTLLNLKKGTLFYLGVNTGESFLKYLYRFKHIYAFEPNPKNFKKIKYLNKFPGINIYQKALSDNLGISHLHIPSNSNNSASASLSDFSKARNIDSIDFIEVETINLNSFLKDKGIENIDFYLSDIEGYDLKVLKTIKPYLDNRKILKIQVEAVINGVENPFKSATNYESDFDSVLSQNYIKIARGWGNLQEGQYEQDIDNYSLVDLLYKLK